MPSRTAAPTFVVAGSGEAREGGANYRERTVRYGETSPEPCAKRRCSCWARWSGGWVARLPLGATTATQVYTVHDLHPFLADEIVRRGAARAGLTWHFCRPPVQGLEYEMDCRGVGDRAFRWPDVGSG